ncbi:MAG: flippase-like domain-containing protein, partial [Deltaproteobacteria bacterium]|nr:flippase-like domain-containing protein [Deltaproteobacteria bacterium]
MGFFLVYLSFRGVNMRGIVEGLKEVKLSYIPPVLLLLVCIQMLRSYRWGIIMKPLKSIDQFSLFAVTSVGFLAVVSIPARIGELARPYLISTKTGISMPSAVGTILVERVFDGLSVLSMFFIIVPFTPLPPWLIRGSLLFLFITLAFLGIIILLIFRREASFKLLAPLLRKFPERWHLRLANLIDSLIDGFTIIPHRRSMCYL